MSSRSKALIGGALAIIFVITVANTNATAQLSKAVNNVNSRVASLPTQVQESYPQEEYYVGGQQAALGLVGVDIPEPDDEGGGGYWIYIGSDGDLHCAYMIDSTLFINGSLTFSTSSNGQTTWTCAGASAAPATPNGGGIHFDYMVGMDTVQVSGGVVHVMQFQLFLLGYLYPEEMTGLMDTNTTNAVTAFQKAYGLPSTGRYGEQTKAAVDRVLSSRKATGVTTTTKFIFSK